MSSAIRSIRALEILDSRGYPTVECQVVLESGAAARASVPSGASVGSYEACEKRDNDPKRFRGRGVRQVCQSIEEVIAPALLGQCALSQEEVDDKLVTLDGSPQKNKLGANALLAVSLAVAKAAAQHERLPFYRYLGGVDAVTLPVPMMNIINGGQHANNKLDIQEFMIIPAGFDRFSDALQAGTEIFHTLKGFFKQKGLSTAVGDEGGFAPDAKENTQVFDWLLEAVDKAGYKAGKDIYLALDVAASELHQGAHYTVQGKKYDASAWVEVLTDWVKQYPIVSIEDGMDENDWEGWQLLTKAIGKDVQLVGDDVFVTQVERLKMGIEQKAANAILIKPNQTGTLTETLCAIGMAKNAGFGTIISHRSGETEDCSIADIAVGTDALQIKTGSLCRTDRIAKYNQLLRIELELGQRAVYPGREVFGA